MSEIYRQLRNLAVEYIAGEVPLDDFRPGFAGLYFRARQSRKDLRSNSLASKITGPLAELSRHHRDEESFRRELISAIGPLEGAHRVSGIPHEIVYGKPPGTA